MGRLLPSEHLLLQAQTILWIKHVKWSKELCSSDIIILCSFNSITSFKMWYGIKNTIFSKIDVKLIIILYHKFKNIHNFHNNKFSFHRQWIGYVNKPLSSRPPNIIWEPNCPWDCFKLCAISSTHPSCIHHTGQAFTRFWYFSMLKLSQALGSMWLMDVAKIPSSSPTVPSLRYKETKNLQHFGIQI